MVYDITNSSSLEALSYFHEMIEMEEEQRIDSGAVPPIKIVAGNKCDLGSQRVVKSAQGLEWARTRRCGFMETSAREMVNIEETFARMPLLRPALKPANSDRSHCSTCDRIPSPASIWRPATNHKHKPNSQPPV